MQPLCSSLCRRSLPSSITAEHLCSSTHRPQFISHFTRPDRAAPFPPLRSVIKTQFPISPKIDRFRCCHRQFGFRIPQSGAKTDKESTNKLLRKPRMTYHLTGLLDPVRKKFKNNRKYIRYWGQTWGDCTLKQALHHIKMMPQSKKRFQNLPKLA